MFIYSKAKGKSKSKDKNCLASVIGFQMCKAIDSSQGRVNRSTVMN